MLKAQIARDHRERTPGRETRDQIFCETVGEEGLLGIGREVVEGQHRDGRHIGLAWSRSYCGCGVPQIVEQVADSLIPPAHVFAQRPVYGAAWATWAA